MPPGSSALSSVVHQAVPTVERDGWLIGTYGFEETAGETVFFAEDSLERTGLAEDWGDPPGDTWEWVPVGERNPPLEDWEDTIWVDLTLDWALEGEDATPEEDRRANALAESAAAVLEQLVPTKDEIGWAIAETGYEPFSVDLWLDPAGDALEADERIVAEPSQSWLHGEDDEGFLESTWKSPPNEQFVFLVPSVCEAHVRLEYYSSPERLARRGT